MPHGSSMTDLGQKLALQTPDQHNHEKKLSAGDLSLQKLSCG